jgi:chemotaxis signal transduction protein
MQGSKPVTLTQERVLIFPAQTPDISGNRVHFLFSVQQVKDILQKAEIFPVPFAPPYAQGIAQWRHHVVPVISLEARLEMEIVHPKEPSRLVLVRGIEKSHAQLREVFAMITVVPAMRMMDLPSSSVPITVDWFKEKSLIRGVYEWEEGFLIVVHMENILRGKGHP